MNITALTQAGRLSSPSTRWANWVGCRPLGGNVQLAAPVPEYAYFAKHVRLSAIADAVAQRSTAYLLRKRVDGLGG